MKGQDVIETDGCVLVAWSSTPGHWYVTAGTRRYVLNRFGYAWELHEATAGGGKGALIARTKTRRAVLARLRTDEGGTT